MREREREEWEREEWERVRERKKTYSRSIDENMPNCKLIYSISILDKNNFLTVMSPCENAAVFPNWISKPRSGLAIID